MISTKPTKHMVTFMINYDWYIFGVCCHCCGCFRGDAFYADVNTLGLEEMHKDSEDGIDRMCTDLEKQ